MNAERLLGGIIRGAISDSVFGSKGSRRRKNKRRRKNNLFGLNKMQIGMGVLATAVAAFDHFSNQKSDSSKHPPGEPVVNNSSSLPPLPSVPTPPVQDTDSTAKIILQAMISAAAADGEIDTQERAAILKKLEEDGLSEQEQKFLQEEMAKPLTIEDITAQVTTLEVAQQVYIASLLAIEVDTEVERNHMSKLAESLGLDEAMISLLHQVTGNH